MFDKERFYKRFSEDTSYNYSAIDRRFDALNRLHPDVLPLIESWLEGKYENFEYQGISIQEIMEKEQLPYVEAIYSMNTFLFHPELVNGYSSYEHYYDIVGDFEPAEE